MAEDVTEAATAAADPYGWPMLAADPADGVAVASDPYRPATVAELVAGTAGAAGAAGTG